MLVNKVVLMLLWVSFICCIKNEEVTRCLAEQRNVGVYIMVYIETCGYDADMKFIKVYSNGPEACSHPQVEFYRYKGDGKC